MPRPSRTVTVVVGLIVITALVVTWRFCRSVDDGPAQPPEGFSTDRAILDSPDIDLELIEVRGTVNPGYTDWACIFACSEERGCRAETRVRISFVSNGDDDTLTLVGRLDAGHGEKMRVGRMQRPPVAVDRIKKVTVEVTAPYTPDAPRPTPMQ